MEWTAYFQLDDALAGSRSSLESTCHRLSSGLLCMPHSYQGALQIFAVNLARSWHVGVKHVRQCQ